LALGVSVMVISGLRGLIPAWASTRLNSSAIRARLALELLLGRVLQRAHDRRVDRFR